MSNLKDNFELKMKKVLLLINALQQKKPHVEKAGKEKIKGRKFWKI